MSKKPNVLFIMSDQFRGDCLSFLDHPDVKTPCLDTLASDSVVYDHANTVCPSCIPARACLFTGKTPEHTGRVGYKDGVYWNYDHMMPEEFKQNGYQTACIGKLHVHPPRLACGFETLKLHDGYLECYRMNDVPFWMHQHVHDDYIVEKKSILGKDFDIDGGGVGCNAWVSHPWIYEERHHPTNWVVDRTIDFLKTRDRTRPFFLMSSFVRPHPPYDAPRAYHDLYLNKDLRKPIESDWMDVCKTRENGRRIDSPFGCCDDELIHQGLAGYYANITHLDHQIGRLIANLKNDGTYDDTIIVFVSDHGDMMFDHGLFRKSLPYIGSARVPCMVHVGKNIENINPRISSTLVCLRDIMPTLLDLCGLDIPDGVDGLSLKEEMIHETPINREYLHGEHSGNKELECEWIVSDHDKFIWFNKDGREQYFDLVKDPKETHNAIHDACYQERINTMRNYLIKELEGREEGYSDGTKLICNRESLDYLSFIEPEEFKI